jgi:hypothetical protein
MLKKLWGFCLSPTNDPEQQLNDGKTFVFNLEDKSQGRKTPNEPRSAASEPNQLELVVTEGDGVGFSTQVGASGYTYKESEEKSLFRIDFNSDAGHFTLEDSKMGIGTFLKIDKPT